MKNMSIISRLKAYLRYDGKIKPLTFKTRCVLTWRGIKVWWIHKKKNKLEHYGFFLKDLWSIWKPVKKQTWKGCELEIFVPTTVTTKHSHIGIKFFPTPETLKKFYDDAEPFELRKEAINTSTKYHIDTIAKDGEILAWMDQIEKDNNAGI